MLILKCSSAIKLNRAGCCVSLYPTGAARWLLYTTGYRVQPDVLTAACCCHLKKRIWQPAVGESRWMVGCYFVVVVVLVLVVREDVETKKSKIYGENFERYLVGGISNWIVFAIAKFGGSGWKCKRTRLKLGRTSWCGRIVGWLVRWLVGWTVYQSSYISGWGPAQTRFKNARKRGMLKEL